MSRNILERLVDNKRLPILFIGSGLSKRYLYKYPNWEQLLEMAFRQYNPDIFQLQKYKDQLSRSGASPFETNIKLATIIENDFNAAFYDRKIKIGKSKNPSWVKKGISPFKMYLATYFKHVDLYHRKDLDSELSKFKSLKTKI